MKAKGPRQWLRKLGIVADRRYFVVSVLFLFLLFFMNASAAAVSCTSDPVRIARDIPVYFNSLQEAYESAADGDVIEVQANAFPEDLHLDRPILASIKGGYDTCFTSIISTTVLQGNLTISDGIVSIENLELVRTSECVIEQSAGNLTTGEIVPHNEVIQSFDVQGVISAVDILFGTYGRINTKDIILHLKDDLNPGVPDLATARVNASKLMNNNWQRFEFSPVKSQKGTLYFIVLESPNSTPGDSVTAWASSGNPYTGGHLYQTNASTDRDLAFRVFTVSDDSGFEYYTWWDLTPDHWDRKIYRDRKSNIAMTFGDRSIMEGGFYEHFLTNNFGTGFDYFCIPDDLIISYNDTFSSWVRAYGLDWTTEHGLLNNKQNAFLRHTYINGAGYNPLTYDYNKGSGILPPADVTIQHDMAYAENYVPMTITIKNKHSEPLRFIYVFQDGAYMSQGTPDQTDVHQYWDDGDYDYSRVWYITDSNRGQKNNWVGMYNDNNDGMFAATYAPPESIGIRYHATWNRKWSDITSPGLSFPTGQITAKSLDPFRYVPITPDWFKYDNLLSNIDALTPSSPYNNPRWKWHGTIIDFGTLQPNEERSQVIVKIMFTGYKDRSDMHARINSIIARIPAFNLAP